MMQLKPNHTGVARPFENGIDRMLEQFSRDLGFTPQVATPQFRPSLDVSENETAWVVRTDLPGVELADVEVSVTGNLLTIRGEKKAETASETSSLRRTERRYGKFERSLEFPTDVDAGKVEAAAKNGVLTITLPKAEASRPRTIPIKTQ